MQRKSTNVFKMPGFMTQHPPNTHTHKTSQIDERVEGEAPMSAGLPSRYSLLGACSCEGGPWLEAGSEWQVEGKEQTAERHRGTMYVLVIQLDDWCGDRMCVPVTACVQSTQ